MSKRRRRTDLKKKRKGRKRGAEAEDINTAVGVAHYRKEDYGRLRRMADDGDELCESWEEWHASIRTLEAQLIENHIYFQRVLIDLDDLQRHCREKGLPNTTHTRARYAASLVRDTYHGD